MKNKIQSNDVGMMLEGASIQHPFSIHSASIGTTRKPGGWKYIFTIMLLLTMGIGQVWGAINNTTVTKVGGSQKYIDVTTTSASNGDEVTVSKQYIAYTISELVSNEIKDVWYTQSSSGSGSSATDAVSITGYRSACSKYIPISSSKKYTHYVTNCVSFSALYDPRSSGRYCTITATNVDDAEDVLTITNSGSVSSGTKYNVELTGLSASKYYSVVVETNNSSESRLYQIRLGAYVNTTGPFAIIYDKNDEGASGTMTDGSSPYAKNSTVTVLANSFTAPTGKVFVEWNTKADGTGLAYDPDDTFSATEDIKLYAQWAYPATGTGTITYSLTSNANAVSAAVSGVSTLSSSSTAFTLSTLTCGSGNSKAGYSGQIQGHAADYSASQYVALQFSVADGYEFTPSAVSMTVFANSTSAMKMKLVLTDGTTSVETNELTCLSSADYDIEFASGAFTNKKLVGDVDVILYQWGVTSKRTYIKSPVTITGTIASAAPSSFDITINPNGGSYESAPEGWTVSSGNYKKTVSSGDAVTLPDGPAKSGSVFNRWKDGEGNTVTTFTASAAATYTAEWKAAITYSKGGDAYAAADLEVGNPAYYVEGVGVGSFTALANISGYKFKAWSPSSIATDATGAKTITATWDAVTSYDVKFYTDNGSTCYATIPVIENEKASAPTTDPTKSGYRFVGWAESYGGSAVTVEDITITAAKNFYAVWQEVCTVTFNSNGGSTVDAVVVDKGSKVSAPTAPTRSNWTFSKWQLSGADYDFDATVTADITLDAVWSRDAISGDTYDVTLSSGTDLVGTYSGGGVSINLNAVIGRGAKNTSNGGIKFNYGISSSTDGTNYIQFTIPSGYSANVKTLTLYGSNEVIIVDATSGGNTIYSSTGTPNGTFTSGNTYYMCRAGSSEVVLSSVLTLTASPISVTFKDGEETKYSKTAAKNETLGNLFDNGELPSLADKTGYTFGGWAISGAAVTKATEVTTSVTVDAVWTAKTTALTLDKNDANATADGSATATYGSSTLTDYVAATRNDGKALTGYYDDPTDGTLIIDKDGALVAAWSNEAANETLYAHWASNVNVTFYNGEAVYEVVPVAYGTVATAPATDPTKSGYRFMGWAATSGGSVVVLSDYTITAERAFYAVFAQEYTVSFDASPSSAVIANQVVINGEKVLAPTDPTLAKWDFVEWQVAGAAYDFDNTTYTDDIELVATWARAAVPGAETDEVVVGASPSLEVVTAEYGYSQSYENGDYVLTGGMVGGTSGKRYVGVTIPENYSGKISITIASSNTRTGVVVDEDHKTNYSATENNLLAVAATSGGATGQSGTLSAGTYYVTSVGGGATLKNISVHLYAPEITVVFKDGETTKYSFTAAKNETLGDLFIDGNLPTLNKDGFTFDGWLNGEDAVSASTTITESLVLNTQWTGEEYNLVLKSNNSNSDGSAKVAMGASALTNISAPTAETGKGLRGYYAASDGDVKVADKNGNLQANVTGYTDANGLWTKLSAEGTQLFAHWDDPIAVRFFVESVQYGETQYVFDGDVADAPADPTRTGYRFMGWSVDGTNPVTLASYTISAATDFTALWTQEFKVEFDLQGGTGDIEDQYVLINEYPVAVTAPTRDQADFLGWSLTANGDVVDITTVAITEAKKFYARWELTLVLNQVVFSNGFDAFIDASANTVKAYYMAGQSAPTVASYAGVNLKAEGGVTIINEGATLRIIGTDDTYTDFALTLEAVTPMSSFDKQTFDGLENYVKAGNSFHSTEKWYVSKNANDGRIPLGKTRMYFFVGGGADKATFTATVQERNIRVYVNNELVSSVTKTAAAGSTFDIPLNAAATNNMIAIVSNQTSGDGGVADVQLNEHAASTSVALSSLTYQLGSADPVVIPLVENQYAYAVVLPMGTTDNPVVAAVAKDAPYETISEITQATSPSGTATFTVTPESGAPQVYTVKFSVSRARSLVIYDGNSLEASGSLEPGLQWTTTGGSTSESSASAQTFEGKSYTKYVNIFGSATKAPEAGNTRYMTITVPENYLAKFRLVGCGNSTGDRSLFISKEITSTRDESIAFAHTTTTNITGMTSDLQFPGTYYLCCDNSIRLYELSVELYPLDYSREVTQGIYGTICLPNGGVMVGADLFEVAYMDYQDAKPYKIYFDQIVSGEMEAGMPYIFLPHEDVDQVAVTYTDNASASAGHFRGLHGTMDQIDGGDLYGKYIFYQNTLFMSENLNNWLSANRAYIVLDEVPGYAVAPMPGRKRISMGVNAPQTPTGMDALNASDAPVKVIINGELFILRGEKMYDATGRLVK